MVSYRTTSTCVVCWRMRCRWAAHDTFDLLLVANRLGFFYGLVKCLQRCFNVLKVWSPWVASFTLLLYLELQAY